MDDLLNIADTFDAPEGVEGVMKWDVNNIFYNYWIVGNYMIVGGDPGMTEMILISIIRRPFSVWKCTRH